MMMKKRLMICLLALLLPLWGLSVWGQTTVYHEDELVAANAQDEWIDVTNLYLKNPSFDDNNGDYWNREVYAQGNDVRLGAMEVFNGTFNISQELKGLPKGRYRLSVQGFYRSGNNVEGNGDNGFKLNDLEEGFFFEGAYPNFWNESEQLTAYLYGGTEEQPLVSVYSESLDENVDGSFYTYRAEWNSDTEEYVDTDFTYYPNNMEGGVAAFQEGKYWNSVEFDAEGEKTIGVANENYMGGNWCMFDNFKLEFQGEVVTCTGVKLSLENTELLIEQIAQIQAEVTPANAFLKALKWTSSNPDVVFVDQEGVIVAWKEGTAVITATTTDGSDISDSITITVVSEPSVNDTSIDFNESKDSNVNSDRLYFGSDEIVVKGDDGPVRVEIYTADGSLVERTTVFVQSGSARLSTSHLPAGFYVARATVNQTTCIACKFVK